MVPKAGMGLHVASVSRIFNPYRYSSAMTAYGPHSPAVPQIGPFQLAGLAEKRPGASKVDVGRLNMPVPCQSKHGMSMESCLKSAHLVRPG